jgi:ankyrin repeat protein
MITREININEGDDFGNSSLFYAIMNNDDKMCRILLNTKNIDINKQNNNGESILHIICKYKLINILKLILCYYNNIDYNIKNNKGEIPISYIIIYNKYTEVDYCIYEYLLKYTSVDLVYNIIDIILNYDNDIFLKLLLKCYNNILIDIKFHPYICLVKKSYLCFKAILNHNENNINIQDCLGKTILHYIITEYDQTNMYFVLFLNILLKYKINLNIIDIYSNTCFHYILYYKNKYIFNKLLLYLKITNADLNFNIINNQGYTMLDYSIINNMYEEFVVLKKVKYRVI